MSILNLYTSLYFSLSEFKFVISFHFHNRWKLLDFALLKRSSVSFFDIDKPETVVSKWSRARTRAAKVCLSHLSFCIICIWILIDV
jgi:hypothetical protein